MKRFIGASIAAVAYSVVLPLAALAQEIGGSSSLDGPEGPIVGGTGGTVGGGGSAFTGAEIAGLVLLALGLLIAGAAIVVFTRRRPASRIEA